MYDLIQLGTGWFMNQQSMHTNYPIRSHNHAGDPICKASLIAADKQSRHPHNHAGDPICKATLIAVDNYSVILITIAIDNYSVILITILVIKSVHSAHSLNHPHNHTGDPICKATTTIADTLVPSRPIQSHNHILDPNATPTQNNNERHRNRFCKTARDTSRYRTSYPSRPGGC